MAHAVAPFRVCAACARPESESVKLWKCGKCRSVLYCSKECQRVGFPTHRESCARLFEDAQTAQQLAAKDPNWKQHVQRHRDVMRCCEATALQDALPTPAGLPQLFTHFAANMQAVRAAAAGLSGDIERDWLQRQRELFRQTPEQRLESLLRMRVNLLGEMEENLARLPSNVLASERQLLRDMRLRLNSGDPSNNLGDAIKADAKILNTLMLRILEASRTL